MSVIRSRTLCVQSMLWLWLPLLLLLSVTMTARADALKVFLDLLNTTQSHIAPQAIDNSNATKTPDFSAADRRFETFLRENPTFDGISYVLVDASGVIHQRTFGDHFDDLVTMIASTSKVPAVMTLLALEEDTRSDFSLDKPIGDIFPVSGVYADRTPAQLVSNTSGIPGLDSLLLYGSHLCQFSFDPVIDFEMCGTTLFTSRLVGTQAPGSTFDYGGSQWQLAGMAAVLASNKNWNQLVHEYLSAPCGLEVFTFGNMWEDLSKWTGTPDSLLGTHNPSIEGGAITTLSDYAKLLSVHLNGGFCGEQRVLNEKSLTKMQEDRGSLVQRNPTAYGMGWFIADGYNGVFYDPGAFGSVSFIDTRRGIGGFVAIDEYSRADAAAPVILTLTEILPLIQKAIDSTSPLAKPIAVEPVFSPTQLTVNEPIVEIKD